MMTPAKETLDYFREQFNQGNQRCREVDGAIRKELSLIPSSEVPDCDLFTRVSRGVMTSALMCNTHYIAVENGGGTLVVRNRSNADMLILLEKGPVFHVLSKAIRSADAMRVMSKFPQVVLHSIVGVVETFGLIAGLLASASELGMAGRDQIEDVSEVYYLVDHEGNSVKVCFFIYAMKELDLIKSIIDEEMSSSKISEQES